MRAQARVGLGLDRTTVSVARSHAAHRDRSSRFLEGLRVCIFLLIVLFAGTNLAQAAATSESQRAAAELGQRIDDLQILLDAVRDAKGEALRQDAMQRHWNAMQGYMRASLKHTVEAPSASGGGGGGADCQLAGGTWKGLSFPGQLRSDDYLRAMQAHTGRMREAVLAIHGAADAAALDAALRAHWRDNYEALQRMRGLDWMFDGWKPAESRDALPPDPGSDGAQLTQAFCSVCHAVPPARLHTAQEWDGVMATMQQHMMLSDTGMPMCMQMPSGEQIETIRAYYKRYAR